MLKFLAFCFVNSYLPLSVTPLFVFTFTIGFKFSASQSFEFQESGILYNSFPFADVIFFKNLTLLNIGKGFIGFKNI